VSVSRFRGNATVGGSRYAPFTSRIAGFSGISASMSAGVR
jgi:hypothetical protein